MMLYILAVPTI